MKEKIFEWGNVWGTNVTNINESENFIWFDMDDNLSRRMIKTLEEVTNTEFDSVGWNIDLKLQIWLYKKYKGE